jgi:predicted nucleotidyltransferase
MGGQVVELSVFLRQPAPQYGSREGLVKFAGKRRGMTGRAATKSARPLAWAPWRRRHDSVARPCYHPGMKTADAKELTMAGLGIEAPALAALCRRWRVRELALCGSMARGAARPDSDIDLLVSSAPEAGWSLLDLARMSGELQDLFGRPVDLIEERALRNPFRRRALLAEKAILHAA